MLCGSQASLLGERRALRFWEIVSSTALRDMRRKSGRCVRRGRIGQQSRVEECVPCRAVWLKQKAGVSFGAGVVVGAAMVGTRTGGGGREGDDGGDVGVAFQKYPASLIKIIRFAVVQCIKKKLEP